MRLEEWGYRIRVVSASEKLSAALPGLLPAGTDSPVFSVTSVAAAKRVFAEQAFDFVIVNSPLPDDSGIRFASDVCRAKGTVALLIVRADLAGEIYHETARHGVFTLTKPTSHTAIAAALRWMVSARERLRAAEQKTQSIEEKMEEIRLVNRAKWMLIQKQNMDEQQAHRYLEKKAMDRCVTKKEIALQILQGGDGVCL